MLPLHDLKALSENYKQVLNEKRTLEEKQKQIEEDMDTAVFTKEYTKQFETNVLHDVK